MDSLPLAAAARALDAVAQALAAVAEAGAANAAAGLPAPLEGAGSRLLEGAGLAERLGAEVRADGVHEPSGAPVAAADPAAETATLQNLAKAPLPAGELPAQARAEPEAPTAGPATDFALPDAQLAPAVLVGLQVDAGWAWMLPPPQAERSRRPEPAAERERSERSPREHEDGADAQAREEDAGEAPAPAPAAVVLDGGDGRLATLMRALRRTLAAADAPPALRAAVEQWQRGRRVIVACPQAAQPQGPAWAFVLAPQPGARADGGAALGGPRFEGRLWWPSVAAGPRWCHARLVKEHHPRRGRQLVPADRAAPAACGIQLGPVLAEPLPGGAVRLRIDAAQRFWNALDLQWSVLLVVSALPLAGGAAVDREEAP